MKASIFNCGFRPHFLLAGLAAMLLLPMWSVSFVTGSGLGSSWPPTLWHAHEMLFGFIACAVAGFLLTAVPSWTGAKGFAGLPLIMLTGLWLLARLMIATSATWPPWSVAAVDLAFLPALGALVGWPLLRERSPNTPMLLMLCLLWGTNLVFHAALVRGNVPLATHALRIGIDIVLLLVTVIGGRIVPAFTNSALRSDGLPARVRSSATLSILTIAAMALVMLFDIAAPDTRIDGGVAGAAAILQALRLAQWDTLHTLRKPIVWVLHLAYLWIPVGLALKSLALLLGLGIAAFWLHALTVGALTTMILAVMTRAALGHTGRPLVVDPLITLAYGLLTLAALTRVFGLAVLGVQYPIVITAATYFWTAAFVLFVAVYAPILWCPRADGRPG